MSKTTLEFWAYAAFTGLVAAALYLTRGIDLAFSKDLATLVGPRAYPRMVLGALLVMSCLLLLRSFRAMKADALTTDRRGDPVRFRPHKALKVGAVFAATLGFALTFEPLGYLVTVPAIMMVIAHVNGGRNYPAMLATSLAMALLCLLVFRYGLNTVLPEGVLGIDMLTRNAP